MQTLAIKNHVVLYRFLAWSAVSAARQDLKKPMLSLQAIDSTVCTEPSR